jgi:hypothetical protein
MLCKSVHVLRPRASTSGGQSGGGPFVLDAVALELVFEVAGMAILKEAKELQERQL